MADQQYPVPRKLWEHPNPKSTTMWKFWKSLEKAYGVQLQVSRS